MAGTLVLRPWQGKCQERGLENLVCLNDLSVDSLILSCQPPFLPLEQRRREGSWFLYTWHFHKMDSLPPLKEGQGWKGACKLRDMLGIRPLPSFKRLPSLAPYKLLGAYQVFNDLLDALSGCLHTFLGTLESHFVTLCARSREANHHPTILLGDFPQDLASSNNKMTVVFGIHQHVVFHHIVLQHGDKRKKVKDQR